MTGLTISSNSAVGYNLGDPALNPVSIASGVTIASTATPALYSLQPTYWTIVNSGTLRQTGALTLADGILLQGSGGAITNTAGGSITGNDAGVSIAGIGTVVNSGTIATGNVTGSGYRYASGVLTATTAGVILGGGGVSNAASGSIVSYFEGVAFAGSGSVVNAGTISATSTKYGFGVMLPSGGSVTNASGGAISAGVNGILALQQAATVLNNGGIYAQNGVGVYLFAGGDVTNGTAGTISGGSNGVVADGDASTVINQGHIDAQTNTGIYLGAGGVVGNGATGSIYGGRIGVRSGGTLAVSVGNAAGGTIKGARYGLFLGATNTETVTNSGIIAGVSSVGAVLLHAGSISNAAGGVITGASDGIYTAGAAGSTIANAGTLSGLAFAGAFLHAGGSLTNTSTGSIFGQYFGVKINTAGGTAVNAGRISDTKPMNGAGVQLAAGGAVTNQAGGYIGSKWMGVQIDGGTGTVINQGTILANDIQGNGAGVWIHSAGTIFNEAGGTISGGAFAIVAYDQTTVVNQGTIFGTQFAFDAINPGFVNRIIDMPGGVFSGIVNGGNTIGSTIVSTLELASGASTGTIVNAGTFVGFGQIELDAGARWVVGGSLVAGETIAFGGDNASLTLTDPSLAAATIAGFDGSDTLVLAGITDVTGISFDAGNVLTVTESGGPGLSLHFNAQSALTFSVAGGSTQITTIPCFLPGTYILTGRGEVVVEKLVAGDAIVTFGGRTRRLCWIGTGRAMVARGRRSAATPVIVRKGALADNVPNRDLHITKGHSLYLDDVLIPVEFLVNHRSVLWDDSAQEVTVFHLELDEHDVLVANGAPAESYRDDGNRWLFHNANDGWDQPAKPACAPVLTGGDLVDAIWRRILDRSGARPGLPLTEDPDLHLLVDGVRVDAAEAFETVRVFRLDRRPARVCIASREGIPAELGLARDPRALGVALRRVAVRQGTRFVVMQADDDRLTDGFHEYEAAGDLRWTNGQAVLPTDMFAGFEGGLEIVLHVAGTIRYLQDGTGAGQLAA